MLKALQFQNSNSTAKDLAFREALLGKSPACILLLHTDVASFSNFLATFDQDLWQALILKRLFSVNDSTYNDYYVYAALIVMHVFQSTLASRNTQWFTVSPRFLQTRSVCTLFCCKKPIQVLRIFTTFQPSGNYKVHLKRLSAPEEHKRQVKLAENLM